MLGHEPGECTADPVFKRGPADAFAVFFSMAVEDPPSCDPFRTLVRIDPGRRRHCRWQGVFRSPPTLANRILRLKDLLTVSII